LFFGKETVALRPWQWPNSSPPFGYKKKRRRRHCSSPEIHAQTLIPTASPSSLCSSTSGHFLRKALIFFLSLSGLVLQNLSRQLEGFMRVLVQRLDTEGYWDGNENWIENPDLAYDFRGTAQAAEFCSERKLRHAQIVLKFREERYDIRLPPPGD
jgi:hypothetical protein